MAKFLYPAGTNTLRNLEPRFYYFLVVKPDSLVDDIPQKEYFVYRFKNSVTSKNGINSLKRYFSPVNLIECRQLNDTEYATGVFDHPEYTNQDREPLQFNLRDLPIYKQVKVGTIDLNKDLYTLGSKPIITTTNPIIE